MWLIKVGFSGSLFSFLIISLKSLKHRLVTFTVDQQEPGGSSGSVPTHLDHGLLVHVLLAVGVGEQQAVSLQGLQGSGGRRRTVVSLQGLRSGSVRLQQQDDVLSGLRRHGAEYKQSEERPTGPFYPRLVGRGHLIV